MKHMKMLGLLVMAAASLMAFAGSASATPVLTGPNGSSPAEIHATLEKGTTLLLEAGISDTCTASTVKGTVETNDTTHAAGPITVLNFGEDPSTTCSKDTTVLANGSLTINDKAEVFAIGNKVTVKDTELGISCVYGGGASPGTKIGTLTPGTPAKLKINTTELPKQEGGFFCLNKGTWTGNYVVTSPTTLSIT